MRNKIKNKHIKNPFSKFHFSFSYLLAFLFSFIMGNGYIFLLYTITIIIHEMVHIIVASKLGYTLDKFSLSVLGASMSLEDENFFSSDELKIALSAPLFNLFVFISLSGLWWIVPSFYNFTFDFALVNLFVFAINILPIFSLDGGRIVVFILSKKMQRKKAVNIIRGLGIGFAILFFVLFLVSFFFEFNFSLGMISIFLFNSCTKASGEGFKKISSISKKDKLKNGLSLEIEEYIFASSARLIDLYRKLKTNSFARFFIQDSEGSLIFDEDKLYMLIEKYGAGSRVCDCKI